MHKFPNFADKLKNVQPSARPVHHPPDRRAVCFRIAFSVFLSPFILPDTVEARISLSDPSSEEERRRKALQEISGGLFERRRERQVQVQEVPISVQVEKVLGLMSQAEEASQHGDYKGAYNCYEAIIRGYPDLALAERARIKRALLAYQLDMVDQTLAQLEDAAEVLKGSPEVHAALAAVLWVEVPLARSRAEQNWSLAEQFDPRFKEVGWVKTEKKWPPRLLNALEKFLTLSD